MNAYRAGVDIGSTTVKLAVIDDKGEMVYGEYRRHRLNIRETLGDLIEEAYRTLGDCCLDVCLCGSGSISLSDALGIPFVQEVVAVAKALKAVAPKVDVAIELGGEDAKIIYFANGIEERMNGVCAGGTGSFIDQMAALLQTNAEGLNKEAESFEEIYPIAARCGVFAKSDIQPLINDGASKADLAASIFQAVVNQTVSGLACGKPIRGRVAFLGGPLHFLPELKKAFIRTLNLTADEVIDSENSHLFAALGAAMSAGEESRHKISELAEKVKNSTQIKSEMPRLEPLFADREEYTQFCNRHARADVVHGNIEEYTGNCYLGIDAGSTTTKLAVIGDKGELLFSHYINNQGNPIKAAISAIEILKQKLNKDARIVRACSTGYGEALLKAAFCLDEGEVETVAHCTAAMFFEPEVDCVLDIGGQDMKYLKLKNNIVDTVILNEACSSGCGSFVENFANSMGMTAAEFADEAVLAKAPVDLGTRCTVFMNSNVKQAQKEGASIADISAGLAYSVIKNALFKVIKLTSGDELGKKIVLQGGTFHNAAVLRAFEKIAGVEATCPKISGLMGAFGAALIAREHYSGGDSSMLSLDEIIGLDYQTSTKRCGGCTNNCMLTLNRFSGGRTHISGNRCEKAVGGGDGKAKGDNIFDYKLSRIFACKPLPYEAAKRGVIGIPRVLNMYENYPFWATLFKKLGFAVETSPLSNRKIYELGMESIPSESECYPAKLSHGHVEWLIRRGIKTIFHPCVFYEHKDIPETQNSFNCPIVISYPENLKNNVEAVAKGEVRYIRPFISFANEKTAADRLVKLFKSEWNIPEAETRAAVAEAWAEQQNAKADIRAEGARLLEKMRKNGGTGIVLCGRPYHVDPEINHGIPQLIAAYGFTVLTEDSLPKPEKSQRPIRVLDQWVYHSRLYSAAEYVSRYDDLELVQLNSFGCGLDAVTCDQVNEILEGSNKLYTVLKIDEVNNLGAVRIRIRSLIAAMEMRRNHQICANAVSPVYNRVKFTKQMFDEGYTILAPNMSPVHFDIAEPVFKLHGYNVEILKNDNRKAIDTGLKFVNNDACYPSIVVVGQIMEAILSGRYNTDKLAVVMTQTGGCCRASNYVGFIRRALEKAGFAHIPVIAIGPIKSEKNEGFALSPGLLGDVVKAFMLGDLIMRCLYRVRPYERTQGSADKLRERLTDMCAGYLTGKSKKYTYKGLCERIVQDFDELSIFEDMKKPRVGIVGEILVKYMPLANNNLVDLLEKEGAEAVVPDFIDFAYYVLYNSKYKHKFLGESKRAELVSDAGIAALNVLRKPAADALKNSKRFSQPVSISQIAGATKPFLSLGNQYGEGWFLTGEMTELLDSGVNNIICIQPFGCLPNHVVGKGVIKRLKEEYPSANITAVDYDASASEVNQLNRIKLMLANAKEFTEDAK